MLLGLDTYSHHLAFGRHPDFHPRRPMDLFAFIEKVSEYGLNGFQIDPMHLGATDDEYLTTVREEAESRGFFLEYGIMSTRAGDIRKGIHLCEKLGSTILRTFIGFNRYDPKTRVSEELDFARKEIASCLPDLERSGVRLAVENHGDVRSDELVRLVEEIDSPHVGICLDVGNSLCVLEEPLAAAKRMIPFAFTVHFKDYTIQCTPSGSKITGVPLGEGVLPLSGLYRLIDEEGMLDRLILEIPLEPGHGEKHSLEREEEAIRRSVAFCKENLFVGNP
ncbi:MAG: sugar phosphate isomerase/epimerase family protein [Bacteroidota bacterium]